MITGGDIKKIKQRSNKNGCIAIVSNETTFGDITNLGDVHGYVVDKNTFTGDCLALNTKYSEDAYSFKVYRKDGTKYKLDSKSSLYIDFSMEEVFIEYTIEVTADEYREYISKIRKRKVASFLNSVSLPIVTKKLSK